MLKIRSESLPDRCEICHQSDQMNPISGECARCKEVSIPDEMHSGLKDLGLTYRFAGGSLTRLVAAGLAAVFASPLIGLHGVVLFAGSIVFLKGLQRFLEDKELLGRPALDQLLNLVMIWSGLAAFFWAVFYFLKAAIR